MDEQRRFEYATSRCAAYVFKNGGKNLRFKKITWLVWTGPKYPRFSDYQNPLLTLESFSNDHGDETAKANRTAKTATGLIYEKTTLHEHHAFSLQNCDVKLPNFSFFCELRHRSLESNSRKIRQHLTYWTRYNKGEEVWSSANSLFVPFCAAIAVIYAKAP